MKKENIHILRYGTVAENDYLKNAVDLYDYLAINGNSAAHIPSAISKFIVNNFLAMTKKDILLIQLLMHFKAI